MTTERTRRQRLLLGVLVAVLAGLVLVRWMDGGSSGAPTPVARRPAPGGRTAAAAPPVGEVRLGTLAREAEPLRPTTRNPFRFRERVVERPAAPIARAPEPTYDGPSVPAGPPPPPPIALRFIGLLGKTAVLRDPSGNPVYGNEGDIIDGRYRVLRVSADSLDIAYVDGRGRQTLRLTSP